MNKKYKGVFAVICTPFQEDGKINETALRHHIRWLIDECKVHVIIPCGSTGEFAFLTEEERKSVVKITIEEVNGQIPVIAGAAACSTSETLMYAQAYQNMGVDGVMVVSPYYGSLKQEELYYHFSTLAENIDIPIILYNNPGTSGSDILPPLVARLAKFDNITAIKESTGLMQRVVDINLLCEDSIEVLCGCDTLVMEMFAMGVEGWVAAPSNVAAKQCVKLYELMVEEKNTEKAWELYKKIRLLFDLFENSGSYVQLAKAGLEMIGRPYGLPRYPLLPPSDELTGKLKKLLELIS